MNSNQFNKIIENRISKIRKVLASKRQEYSGDANCFRNFETAGRVLNITREKALTGMMIKHFVSILDLAENGGDDKLIDEKIGDTINYLILLEGMLKEKKYE